MAFCRVPTISVKFGLKQPQKQPQTDMPHCTFYLHNKKYIYASVYVNGERLKMSIGETVAQELWAKGKVPQVVKQKMNRIELVISDRISDLKLGNKTPTLREIEQLIIAETKSNRKPDSDKLGDSLLRFIELIEQKKLLNKEKPYSFASVTNYKALHYWIKDDALNNVKLNDITVQDIEGIKHRLITKGRSQNTIKSYVTHMRTFLKRTKELGWHVNTVHSDKRLQVSWEKIETKIYLSEKEIEAIHKLIVKGYSREALKDMLVFGCDVGQRLSDLVLMTPKSRVGDKLILNNKKTGITVVIPLKKRAIEIWDKYDGKLPYGNIDSFNARLQMFFRHIATYHPKMSMYNEERMYAVTQGGKKQQYYYPLHKLISSHIMRRSFATNAYLAGVPIPAIMKITGHLEISTFMKYISIDGEQNASIMQKHPFFS